jgi:hypothetical protein
MARAHAGGDNKRPMRLQREFDVSRAAATLNAILRTEADSVCVYRFSRSAHLNERLLQNCEAKLAKNRTLSEGWMQAASVKVILETRGYHS